MKPISFQTTNWNDLPVEVKKGESGVAYYRTTQFEGVRVRLVEYSANYVADHWCKAGHIVFCLEGTFTSQLADGRSFELSPGMSYIVSDDTSYHKSYSKDGVKLMIVDGAFLATNNRQARNPWRM